LNERLKKLRKALDLTQHEFADKLGISRGNIGSYEVGKSNVGGSVIALICKTFNVNETWLRTGVGEMFREPSDDALDALTEQYSLSHDARILVEEFIKLRSENQQSIIAYVRSAANALTEAAVPEQGQEAQPAQETVEDDQARWEQEARAEAELYYQQRLAEKKRESEASSANGSDVG